MKEEKDYSRDLAEIRSMMERSSKFLSLSGWAGIMAGIYALAGAYIAHTVLAFRPEEKSGYDSGAYGGSTAVTHAADMGQVILLALVILALAVGTAVLLSYRKAAKRGEKLWNPIARRLLLNMAIPLVAGGLFILILLSKGYIGLVAPSTMIFYGLALFTASKFTYEAIKSLGLIQIGLGLLSAYYVGYGLWFWAIGFGAFHIIYGIYMHYKYER